MFVVVLIVVQVWETETALPVLAAPPEPPLPPAPPVPFADPDVAPAAPPLPLAPPEPP